VATLGFLASVLAGIPARTLKELFLDVALMTLKRALSIVLGC
jgi:hypothetical protein